MVLLTREIGLVFLSDVYFSEGCVGPTPYFFTYFLTLIHPPYFLTASRGTVPDAPTSARMTGFSLNVATVWSKLTTSVAGWNACAAHLAELGTST